jgi:carotenoid cleavage dioxygenase-like enzyme
MSRRYLVLAENPLKLPSTLALVLGNRPYIERYRWMPEQGVRLLAIDKESGETVREARTDPFFTFHYVNAFERDGELVIDLVAYEDASTIEQMYLDRLRSPDRIYTTYGRPRRVRLPLGGSRPISHETVGAEVLAFPRIDDERSARRPYRYVYGLGAQPYAWATWCSPWP